VVWDAQTGVIFIRLDNPYSYLGALSWSADGKRIAGGRNGFISIWDSQTGQEIRQFIAGIQSERILSVAWSPNGHWLASGTGSGRIVLWDMLTNQPVSSLEGHAGPVNGLSWSDDSTLLASSSSDGTVLIWKLP
jgi:WD40 repeat protein